MAYKIPAYNGSKNFIFASYSHENSKIVLPIIETLLSEGYRVWYDEGIPPALNWRAEINKHIEKSTVFMVFVTRQSMTSHEVISECSYAINLRKKLHVVYLEDVPISEISPSLRAAFTNNQCLLAHNESVASFETKLREPLLPCKDTQKAASAVRTGQPVRSAANKASSTHKPVSGPTPKPEAKHISKSVSKPAPVRSTGSVFSLKRPLVYVTVVMVLLIAAGIIGVFSRYCAGCSAPVDLSAYHADATPFGSDPYKSCLALVSDVRNDNFNNLIDDIIEKEGESEDYNFLAVYEGLFKEIVPDDSSDPTAVKFRNCCFMVAYTEFTAKKFENYASSGFLAALYVDDAEHYRAHADKLWEDLNNAQTDAHLQDIIDYCRDNDIIHLKEN